MPHSSGQMIAAWSPAARPSRVWPSIGLALRLTTEMSERIAQTRPPPTAGPRTAAMIGLVQLIML